LSIFYPDRPPKDELIVNKLPDAVAVILAPSYGDRAGAAMLFDVSMHGQQNNRGDISGGESDLAQ
jgi:hypothetical protein